MSDEQRPAFIGDRIEVERNGTEITVWNHLTVSQTHYVTAGMIESYHSVSVGDHPGNEPPDYITPEMDDQLHTLDIYPNAEVIDPHDDDIEVLGDEL